MYDPSPVGYSLPASNAFTGFTTTGQNVGSHPIPAIPEQINAKQPFDKGWYFYTKPNKTGNTIFINVPGYRSADIIYSINAGCDYWLAGPGDSVNGFDLDLNKNFIHPLVKHSRFWGFPVRSAEEKEWRCVVVSYNVQTSATLHPPHALHGSPPFMMSWMTQSHIATPYNSQKV